MLILSNVFLTCCEKDHYYTYRLQEDERYVYEEGDRLLYHCSDGSADTFLVEGVRYSLTEESYPVRFFSISDKRNYYSMQECGIHLRNLNGFWETDLHYDGSGTDTARCFRIRVYGDLDSGDELQTCSRIEAGCDGITNYSNWPEACLEGRTGPGLSADYGEFSNVLSEEIRVQNDNTDIEVHYRIHWNSTHGIIRFENLAVDPALRWDLAGKID